MKKSLTCGMHSVVAAAVACALLPQAAAGAQAAKTVDRKAYVRSQDIQLEPGRTVERELARGASDSYRIKLEAGQCVNAEVDQKGVDVHLEVYAPNGKEIVDLDSPNGTRGIEAALVAAETPGVYRLSVRPGEKTAPPGRYSIRIEKARSLTENDRTALEAQKAFAEAGELKVEGTEKALRQSIGKYEESLRLYELAANRTGQVDALHYIARSYQLLREPRKALLFNSRALELGPGYGRPEPRGFCVGRHRDLP